MIENKIVKFENKVVLSPYADERIPHIIID